MSSLTFDVVGIPAPQGSKSAFVRKGTDGVARAVVVEGGSSTGRRAVAAWRDAVAGAVGPVMEALEHAIDEPVAVRLDFRMPLPSTDQLRTRHDRQPDIDKLVRSTLDGLVMGGLLVDDARVCELAVTKRYARGAVPTGARIEVMPLGTHEAADRATLRAARSRGAKGGGT